MNKPFSKKVTMDQAKSWTMEDISSKKGHAVAIWVYNADNPGDATKAMLCKFTEEDMFELFDAMGDQFDAWNVADGPRP